MYCYCLVDLSFCSCILSLKCYNHSYHISFFHYSLLEILDMLTFSNFVTRGCGFESRLWQELYMTEVRHLSKSPNPQLLPGRRRLPTAPSVCALGWVKCRAHILLLVILCIIVCVTNKKIFFFFFFTFFSKIRFFIRLLYVCYVILL